MATSVAGAETVERWGIFELALEGPQTGNPFVDVKLSARFKQGDRTVSPEGFYDGTRRQDNVRWYFGDADTPAALDRTTTHAVGPTGAGSGTLTIGNYNETIHGHGTDRQFRGSLRGILIFGSRIGPTGALPLETIRKHQAAK